MIRVKFGMEGFVLTGHVGAIARTVRLKQAIRNMRDEEYRVHVPEPELPGLGGLLKRVFAGRTRVG